MASRRHQKKSARGEHKKQSGKKPEERAATSRRRSLPNWPVLLLAVAGMALTGYLTLTSWLGSEPLFCGEGSSCDVVQDSRWSALLGLPISFWGLLTYATLGHVAYRVRRASLHWKLGWAVSLIGLAVSVYLTAISLFVIEATCFYCLASLGLLAALFGVIAFQRPAGLPGFSWPVWAGQTAGVAVVLVAALHLHYSGMFDATAGPEDPYLKALATHLSETGAIFYGAYW